MYNDSENDDRDYSKVTTEQFDEILERLVRDNSDTLLSIPGVYEVLSEHFNNEVLEIWGEENPEDEDEETDEEDEKNED